MTYRRNIEFEYKNPLPTFLGLLGINKVPIFIFYFKFVKAYKLLKPILKLYFFDNFN